jgi:hypothetical protein
MFVGQELVQIYKPMYFIVNYSTSYNLLRTHYPIVETSFVLDKYTEQTFPSLQVILKLDKQIYRYRKVWKFYGCEPNLLDKFHKTTLDN